MSRWRGGSEVPRGSGPPPVALGGAPPPPSHTWVWMRKISSWKASTPSGLERELR
jgi:hypothetical protein